MGLFRNGQYFITINTYGRECHFGEIIDGKMILNDFGKIVTDEWFRSFEMRDELSLDEFILMPNHLHAIVVLEMAESVGTRESVDGTWEHLGTHGRASLNVRVKPNVTADPTIPADRNDSNDPNDPLNPNKSKNHTDQWNHQNHYQPQPFERKPKSISSFVAGYKSSVLNKIDDLIDEQQIPIQKFNRRNPLWQANYYDHVIRDNQSYKHILEYIRRNPDKWEEDNNQ